ncbi:hypothetical protein EPUL_003151, partial [Erysiphe pulchra]
MLTVSIDAFPSSVAFDDINSVLKSSDSERKQAIKQANAIFAFKLKNKSGDEESWHIDLKNDGEVRKGLGTNPTVTLSLSDEDFGKLVAGKANPQRMFMTGSLRVSGDIMKANVMQSILKKAQKDFVMSLPTNEIRCSSSLTDAEWVDIQQGVPGCNEPILRHFLASRDSLIDLEKQRRSDHHFRQTCSLIAQDSCDIVDRIRDEERKTIWNSDVAKTTGQKSGVAIYPGMIFSQAKKLMETTKLWQIVKRMPKGALLHAHLNAMVDLDFLFELLLSTPGMHIYCASAITNAKELETAPVRFKFMKSCNNDDIKSIPSIWSIGYIPNSPIPVTEAADLFPDGGRPAFLTWLRSRCSITERETLDQFKGVDDIWRKFSSVFIILDTILFYEPIFRLCIRRIFAQLNADGVRWADLRLAFNFYFYREGNEEPETDLRCFFQVFIEELDGFQASDEGKNFWGSRIIWTGLRNLDTRNIIEDMEACISMKIAYPQLISGYDLVGQEDPGRTLKDLLPELFWFKRQCAQEGIELPFFFHAGECLGDGSETDQNLFDAILLGTRRIGHGFSLYKHPLLIDLVKEKKILVESCQDSIGLTHDFWQALQGWDNLGLAGLASLAENSVRWAAFEDEDAAAWLKGIKEDYLGTSVRAIRLKQW